MTNKSLGGQVMMDGTTRETPATGVGTRDTLEDMFEVILHNDDHNLADEVVEGLMRIFGHTLQLAVKIMLEAHHRGKAVAEVEAESLAKQHRDELQSRGLIATVHRL